MIQVTGTVKNIVRKTSIGGKTYHIVFLHGNPKGFLAWNEDILIGISAGSSIMIKYEDFPYTKVLEINPI